MLLKSLDKKPNIKIDHFMNGQNNVELCQSPKLCQGLLNHIIRRGLEVLRSICLILPLENIQPSKDHKPAKQNH